MEQPPCWQCNKKYTGLFCAHCNALQCPVDDYYSVFGMERKLSLDVQALQAKFYELSRLLHPDRFTRRSPLERQYSLEASSLLNKGYRVLRNPVQRAEYVLKKEGFDIGEQGTKDVPPELLEEVFELNMALEELKMGDQQARGAVEEARQRFAAMRDEIDRELEQLFQQWDEKHERATLQQIRGLLNRRRYIHNLVTEVENVATLSN
ncbi:MAG: Fe-S protein assembly co-chaperone HscB [Bryobacteraceae bacterium]|nr:Fe-S protein assembly co-chaperone HscB [Bryobacteraceae bacterium]MDW8378057.1 Fe-S protein assembly co-chaperone HscB [Bryobacterales bacterium]